MLLSVGITDFSFYLILKRNINNDIRNGNYMLIIFIFGICICIFMFFFVFFFLKNMPIWEICKNKKEVHK